MTQTKQMVRPTHCDYFVKQCKKKIFPKLSDVNTLSITLNLSMFPIIQYVYLYLTGMN